VRVGRVCEDSRDDFRVGVSVGVVEFQLKAAGSDLVVDGVFRLHGVMPRWMATTMFCCYLLTVVTMLTDGQAYHFSQGWLPGGKRSAASPALVDDVFPADSLAPLARLVTAEFRRRTALRQSADNTRTDKRQTNTAFSNPGHHRTGLLRLVGRQWRIQAIWRGPL